MFKQFQINKVFREKRYPQNVFEVVDPEKPNLVRFRSTKLEACEKWIKEYNARYYSHIYKSQPYKKK